MPPKKDPPGRKGDGEKDNGSEKGRPKPVKKEQRGFRHDASKRGEMDRRDLVSEYSTSPSPPVSNSNCLHCEEGINHIHLTSVVRHTELKVKKAKNLKERDDKKKITDPKAPFRGGEDKTRPQFDIRPDYICFETKQKTQGEGPTTLAGPPQPSSQTSSSPPRTSPHSQSSDPQWPRTHFSPITSPAPDTMPKSRAQLGLPHGQWPSPGSPRPWNSVKSSPGSNSTRQSMLSGPGWRSNGGRGSTSGGRGHDPTHSLQPGSRSQHGLSVPNRNPGSTTSQFMALTGDSRRGRGYTSNELHGPWAAQNAARQGNMQPATVGSLYSNPSPQAYQEQAALESGPFWPPTTYNQSRPGEQPLNMERQRHAQQVQLQMQNLRSQQQLQMRLRTLWSQPQVQERQQGQQLQQHMEMRSISPARNVNQYGSTQLSQQHSPVNNPSLQHSVQRSNQGQPIPVHAANLGVASDTRLRPTAPPYNPSPNQRPATSRTTDTTRDSRNRSSGSNSSQQ
ncbi:hypothetical protein MKZ38_010792 [Zalerion maritima]|uniref:Uncharacterized protein n=1 Tax=Zalerion maritima TaxID=339359 RepID=A0AAD5RY30_9PEZI|nr:hypothetical protein MKZ38_010792 [Zalerion maritima]